MRERYSYIFLVVLTIGLSVGTFFAGRVSEARDDARIVKVVQATNEKLCDFVRVVTDTPVKPPKNPTKQPLTAISYKRYIHYLKLDKALQCNKYAA